MTILDEIAEYARKRVKEAKKRISLDEIKKQAFGMPKGEFSFERALRREGMAFICECKKASPSKGVIAEEFPYLAIAKEYETAGADCISVLTEPKYFLGKDFYLKEIASQIRVPCIRKDFVIDEYMIYEAKVLGAQAVLLIVALLSEEEIRNEIRICDELGISALVEAHTKEEIETALSAGARVIGVNNRNLKNFTVNTENSVNLRKFVPASVLFVAESGIQSAEEVQHLKQEGVDAVLIGEALMRAEDKKKKLAGLRGV